MYFTNKIKVDTLVWNNFIHNINHSQHKICFPNKAQCLLGHDPKVQEDIWRKSSAAHWERSERLCIPGPHPQPLCKHPSDVQTLQTSTIWNGYVLRSAFYVLKCPKNSLVRSAEATSEKYPVEGITGLVSILFSMHENSSDLPCFPKSPVITIANLSRATYSYELPCWSPMFPPAV